MKKLLLAGLAAGMLASAAPMAQAAPNHDFRGGCSFDTVNQGTATGQSWIGEADVVIVATDNSANRVPDGSAITNVSCEFFINGETQGTVLTAPNGTGVTANAGRFEFSATDTDTTTMCTHATVGGEVITKCANGEVTQIPPQAVIDAINAVIDLLNTAVFSQLDPTICAALIALSGPVNGLGHPEIIYIDPATGDLSLLDGGFWDCPPYEVV